MPIRFARNLSTAPEIAHHLTECSPSFVPPLATRVAIPAYAAKLAVRAERFEAWRDADLVGLVAVYCPAQEVACASGDAFISNVSVMPAYLRRGIARHLLAEAMAHCRGRAARIALQVDRRAAALRLYDALGFVLDGVEGDTLTLGHRLI